jgi:hypothetical protein
MIDINIILFVSGDSCATALPFMLFMSLMSFMSFMSLDACCNGSALQHVRAPENRFPSNRHV